MKHDASILIIDDELEFCETVEQVISHFLPQSQVSIALSGREGLEKSEHLQPDIVMLDIRLPDIDGYEICKILKDNPQTQESLILVITGLNHSQDLKIEFLELGADAFLKKPFDDSELIAQIKALLRLKSAEAKIKDECKNLKNEVQVKDNHLSIQADRWKLMLENIAEGIWDWDLQSNSIFLSEQWKEMLGYQVEEIDNTVSLFLNMIHPQDYERFRHEMDNYLNHFAPEFRSEIRMKCGDGTYRWFLYRGCAIWDEDSSPVRVLGIQTDITEYKERVFNLETMALYDCLTRLPNRVLFFELVDKAMQSTKRTKEKIGFLFIDLDNFKGVNDRFGHSHGDIVLKTIAERFQSVLRPVDILARFGGDEFVLAIANHKNRGELDIIINRLQDEIAVPIVIEGNEVVIGFSVGHSIFPTEATDIDKLLVKADQRMYKDKERKRAKTVK